MSDVSDDQVEGAPSGDTPSTDADARTDAATDAATGTGKAASAARRPTPAASAASRARRIGGSTGTHKIPTTQAEPAPEPVDPPAATDTGRGWRKAKDRSDATQDAAPAASSTPDPATDERVSMRKRQPRTTSARDLKTEAEAGPAAVPQVPEWLRWAPAVVLSVCALAMIVIIAVAAHGVWYAKPSTSAERDKVLAAAKKCMAAANTYNYKTLAADEKRGLACTTGAWTTQYRSALEKIVKPSALKLKASQTVQINAAGVESVSGSGQQWTTIVYGQLTINQSGATPRIDPFAAIVRLDKVKSRYLVSKIDLITNPNA
jgi:hypothetical protein